MYAINGEKGKKITQIGDMTNLGVKTCEKSGISVIDGLPEE